MSRYSKYLFSFALLMLLAGSAVAQGVNGTVTFYPTGTGNRKSMQSNSAIQIEGHSLTCAQDPVWKGSEVNGKTATNTSLFGPCMVDGVFVDHLKLYQTGPGVLLVLNMRDGTSWSLMLVNSAGVRLSDLINVGFQGMYSAAKFVGFSLFGTHEPVWR